MAKRNEFLHNIALSIRETRRNKLKQSATLAKANQNAAAAQRAYLQTQSQVTAAATESRRNLQYINSLPSKEASKLRKELERHTTAIEKEMQKCYIDLRNAEVDQLNAQLENQVSHLENLLKATLSVDDYFNIHALEITLQIPEYVAPNVGVLPAKPDPQIYKPEKPTGLKKLIPGAQERYEQQYMSARELYKRAVEKYEQQMRTRNERLESAKTAYKYKVTELQKQAEAHNLLVNQFEKEFDEGNPSAIIDYFMVVLEASLYPPDFPQGAKIAFVPESKQLVVEYDLPPFNVIPEIGLYKYIKTKDEIASQSRSASQRKSLYSFVIAQIPVRTIHELFEADRNGCLDTIIFNGYVDAIDRGTGRHLRECLVTVRVTRDVFLGFDLSKVDPIACLKVLNASVSKTPEELAPVKPVLEFNMVDPRFIDETDILSSLDQRPNLMELTPGEFESLIANLFEKMGLETRLTQASRDGGVDCVAYDPRPILGGKVVIQAKRYKHTVGVSAVRDLFGTLQNEGASKGIMVTTSGFGKAAFDFASGKPIELLSGSNLLFLLEQNAGIKAKIVPPENWKDPHPDSDVGESAI